MKKLIIAATLAVVAILMIAPIPMEASAVSTPRYLLLGASVPKTAETNIRNALGSNLQFEAVWGRSWIHNDMLGGPTLWQSFWQNDQTLKAGDWLILEHGHGGVDVATNRGYLQQVVNILPDDVCLAVIQPHTYYDWETPEMQEWNRQMNLMQREVIVQQPCSVQVWWSSAIRAATAANPQLPAWQRALGYPLLYDGRHPTPAGCIELARLIKWAVENTT